MVTSAFNSLTLILLRAQTCCPCMRSRPRQSQRSLRMVMSPSSSERVSRDTMERRVIIAFFAGTFPFSWSCWPTCQPSWDSIFLTCTCLGWEHNISLTNPNVCVQITQQRGLSKSESALLISLIGFFNTGGRIVSGAVTDHPKVDALFMTFLALSWGAVCPFLMTFCYNFWSYTVVCIMFGISLSAWPAVTSSMLVSWATTLQYHSWHHSIGWDAGAFPPDISFWRSHLHERSWRFPGTSPGWLCPRCCWTSHWHGQLHDRWWSCQCWCRRRCEWHHHDHRAKKQKHLCFSGRRFRSYWWDDHHGATNKGGSGPLWGNLTWFFTSFFFTSNFIFQIALYISTLLLGISALGHGFAFCVNKVQKNRRKRQFTGAWIPLGFPRNHSPLPTMYIKETLVDQNGSFRTAFDM